MNLLVFMFALEMGINSNMPLIQNGGSYFNADLEVGFVICDIFFIKGSINTPFDSANEYGFYPIQEDYTFSFGFLLWEWGEIKFSHTCSHQVKNYTAPNRKINTWTGEQITFKIKGEIPLIK